MAKSIAIVAGSFHKDLVDKMVDEARKTASENNLIVEEVFGFQVQWKSHCNSNAS